MGLGRKSAASAWKTNLGALPRSAWRKCPPRRESPWRVGVHIRILPSAAPSAGRGCRRRHGAHPPPAALRRDLPDPPAERPPADRGAVASSACTSAARPRSASPAVVAARRCRRRAHRRPAPRRPSQICRAGSFPPARRGHRRRRLQSPTVIVVVEAGGAGKDEGRELGEVEEREARWVGGWVERGEGDRGERQWF